MTPSTGLRILMLTSSYAPRLGGVEKHVARVARELQRSGHRVRVITPRWSPNLPPQETRDGVPVERLNPRHRWPLGALFRHVAWADLVHSHDAYPFLKYYLPLRFLCPHVPVFVTFHGYESYPIPREARLLRRVVLRLSAGTLCVGAFIPKWYGFGCDGITYGGVDAEQEPNLDGEGAVFVGRVEPDTSLPVYLHALAELRDRHRVRLSLHVCGGGAKRAEAEVLARSLGIHATFHGMVGEVTLFLRAARFAFVSGYLAMLEAMTAGAVVAATYDTPLKEDYLRLFPGAPYIVTAGSAGVLADRLARLVRDSRRRQDMARQAFAFARRQTWAKVARLYLSLYASRGVGSEST